jgi:hypothetical protein
MFVLLKKKYFFRFLNFRHLLVQKINLSQNKKDYVSNMPG